MLKLSGMHRHSRNQGLVMSNVRKSTNLRLTLVLSVGIAVCGGLALYFALSPHEQCVRSTATELKRTSYRLVPERADFSARMLCSERRKRSL